MPMQQSIRSDEAPLRIVAWLTPDEMRAGWPIIRQMYPDMALEIYLDCLTQASRYRQFAASILNDENRCMGVVGAWLLPRVWCGLQVDIDNFVVDRDCRSLGIGKRLLEHCLAFAKEHNATVATLDTYVDNPASHRFYFREGFSIRGYHFVKPLQGQDIW